MKKMYAVTLDEKLVKFLRIYYPKQKLSTTLNTLLASHVKKSDMYKQVYDELKL